MGYTGYPAAIFLERMNYALLVDAEQEINAMHDLYDASYESEETCNPEEKNFLLAMRGVFERLDKITAITHILDGIKPPEFMDVIG
jgi:hypothetical protein